MTAGAPSPAARPAQAAIEQAQIHIAVCRYRRQRLVCSQCFRPERVVGRAGL